MQIETSLKYVVFLLCVEKAKYKIIIHLNRDLGDASLLSLNPLRFLAGSSLILIKCIQQVAFAHCHMQAVILFLKAMVISVSPVIMFNR